MLERHAYVWIEYRRRFRRFLADAVHSRRWQREALLDQLRSRGDSDFGRRHGLATVRSVDEFRKRMPITNYEYYHDYIERVKRGDLRAMFNASTTLLMFALTSGTTGRSKFIPITEQFFRDYRRSWQIWGLKAYHDHRDLLGKHTLQFSSGWRQSTTESGVPCGNISGLAAETRPWVARPMFLLPRSLLAIHDASLRHYTALRIALGSRRVGMLMTANPSTLVEFARRLDRQRESLVRDLFDGTLLVSEQLSPEVRRGLGRWIRRRDRRRARELEQQIDRKQRLYPADAWPGLSLLAVWTGGSASLYLPQLRHYYGELPVRDHGLSASEGRMTIPLQDGTAAGLLDYRHHFFEFIPEDEHGRHDPTVLEAHELMPGRSYFILLTTSSGFYRYDIQDVVRCLGFEGQTPILEFLNKGAHFSNITGEKLSEFQVIEAVKQSCRQLFLSLDHFTLAPRLADPVPYYVLLIESELIEEKRRQLAQQVESQLAQLNGEYADKRHSERLGAVVVQQIPRGTWAAFQKMRVGARGSVEQYKHPCLVNDVQFCERLLNGTRPVRDGAMRRAGCGDPATGTGRD